MEPIEKGTGFTDSEKFVSELADRAFLRLWSYPNVFIDKKQSGKGDGKELADLLVVFGHHVIIFSVKDCEWPQVDDLDLAWSRWCKRAIMHSANQLKGAASWLNKFPGRIFIDPNCSKNFPYEWPSPTDIKIHCVAVAFGAQSAAKKYFNDDSSTFQVIPSLKGQDHTNKTQENIQPFAVGDIYPDGEFIHVFDPFAIGMLLTELDTISDFVDYLEKRKSAIRSDRLNFASGEEDILAQYLQNISINNEHYILPENSPSNVQDCSIAILNGSYSDLQKSKEYQSRAEANRISYMWDDLIELFIGHVLSGTSAKIQETEPTAELAERALRIMASEPRIYRRALAEAFKGALINAADRGQDRYVRTILSPTERTCYTVLILSPTARHATKEGYDEYRKVRANMLETYCLRAFRTFRSIDVSVGIGIDAPESISGQRGGSEDLLAISEPEWTQELRQRFKNACNLHGIRPTRQAKKTYYSDTEFPENRPLTKNRTERRLRQAEERRARKIRRKNNSL